MQKTLDFKGIVFTKLTRGERNAINADLIARRREKFVANLHAAGVKEGEEYFNELEDWDDRRHGLAPFIKFVNEDDGQLAVQLQCLRKSKADATEDDLPEMDDAESLRLACDLSGLKVVEQKPDATTGEPEPRPSEAEAYKTTE